MTSYLCHDIYWHLLHIPSFYPRGAKLSLFSLHGQRFPRYGPIFKIAIFGHETWPLAKVPHVAHIPSLFPIYRVEIKLIFTLRAAFFEIRADFQNNGIFGHEIWQLAKVPDVAHILSFYPSGSKLNLFLLYGQRFPRYELIFKIAIFGHET